MPGYLRPTPDITLDQSYFDPVQKLRVSQPESLIDTDFEYGTQFTKWENLGLTNNRPFAYTSSNQIPNVSEIDFPLNSKTVTVTTSIPHGLVAGSPISVQDTFLSIANGNFIIDSVTVTEFTYTARSVNINSSITSIKDPNKTAIYLADPFTSSRIGLAPNDIEADGKEITVETSVPHGLSLGGEIAVTGATASTFPPNGSWVVSRIIDANTFVYYVDNAPTGTLNKDNVKIYVRPQAQFLHRPLDGGVLFSANASSNNQQAIRQTRKYFRYQSGKGIQISSGTTLKPNLPIDKMTRNLQTITIQTKEQHNLQSGSTVKIFGSSNTDFNGTFSDIKVTGYNTFTCTIPGSSLTGSAIASGEYYVTVESWYGCTNRIGMFDSQNGMFFEFDGQVLSAVVRNSIFQLSGKVSVENGSNLVSQTQPAFETNFSNQLEPGDFIVIRGQSYRVETINSDEEISITPSYRGADADFVLVSKTIDKKIPQSEWNLDTMDGDGPSGYDLDLTKMQMFYIDYSWYGAGFIRFGLRGVDGIVTYCHKIINNNVNAEAYMRSGNLPARYESNTFQKNTTITENIEDGDLTIYVKSTEGFDPDGGTLLIRGGDAFEYVNYTGVNTVDPETSEIIQCFTGLTRAQSGATIDVENIEVGQAIGIVDSITGLQVGQRVIHPSFPQNTYLVKITAIPETTTAFVEFNTAATSTGVDDVISDVLFVPMSSTVGLDFTASLTNPVSVEPAFPTYSASISHWGTAVIMDGNFNDDKTLIYTFSQSEKKTIPASKTITGRTGTGTLGATTFTVSSATDVVTGMSVSSSGIVQANTVVTDINGEVITISQPLVATMPALTDVTFVGGNTKALFSIRLAPSVDTGIAANFGQRELINRMQLQLDSVGVLTSTPDSNLVVTAIMNGRPSSDTLWRNAVKDSVVVSNTSLAQIADYAGNNNKTIILGGEQTGGFYVQGTAAIDLSSIRELGNSVLGGGNNSADESIYPDGPDVLSIVVTNLNATDSVDVFGRLGWFEAQA
jgi:hypothetical protein